MTQKMYHHLLIDSLESLSTFCNQFGLDDDDENILKRAHKFDSVRQYVGKETQMAMKSAGIKDMIEQESQLITVSIKLKIVVRTPIRICSQEQDEVAQSSISSLLCDLPQMQIFSIKRLWSFRAHRSFPKAITMTDKLFGRQQSHSAFEVEYHGAFPKHLFDIKMLCIATGNAISQNYNLSIIKAHIINVAETCGSESLGIDMSNPSP